MWMMLIIKRQSEDNDEQNKGKTKSKKKNISGTLQEYVIGYSVF